MNFARLNHLFIPSTKEGRDRFRRSALGRSFGPVVYLYEALSPEGVIFAVVAIVAGAFGLDVPSTETHVLWGALTALVLSSLVCARLYALDGVRLEVVVPKRVSVGDELTFALVASSEATREHQAIRFAGPFLPWDGKWSDTRPALKALPAGARARVEMRARFSERGEHHLDAFRAAALVPFGLAMGPSVHSTGCRFLVVPKLARVVRVTTPLARRHQPGGVALASKTGESMDLLGVRPYRPGDPVRDLHARTWARVGAPVVREFQQEYFSRIGVVLDTDLGDDAPSLLEAAISLTAGIVAHLSRGEALIDLLVVGRNVHTLTLGRSLGSFEQALDLLACVEAGEPFRADALLERLTPHLSRLSCVVFVALRWDAARAEIDGRVRTFGVGATSIVVGDRAEEVGAVRAVTIDAITRGEALAL